MHKFMRDYSKTREERTGWRDEKLSRRHREWGFDCPAIDIDFIMIEYNTGIPVALIDYKRYTGSLRNLSQQSIKAISILADNSKIPFFVVYYWDNPWAFKVKPINSYAEESLKQSKFASKDRVLSEQEFVRFLYELRNIKLNEQEEKIISRLNYLPPDNL